MMFTTIPLLALEGPFRRDRTGDLGTVDERRHDRRRPVDADDVDRGPHLERVSTGD